MISWFKNLFLKDRISNRDIVIVFLIDIIFKFVYFVFSLFFKKEYEVEEETGSILMIFFYIIIIAPVMEEIAFRGVLRNKNELVYPILLLISPFVVFSIDVFLGLLLCW